MFTKGGFFFFFYRERLLSRFKTAFNIAILQTQYASYWSFLLNTYIFNCETRQNLSHYLYGNILLSSQEYNRNYIYHQKYCNLCMLCYMFWCNHVQNTHMDKLFKNNKITKQNNLIWKQLSNFKCTVKWPYGNVALFQPE